ncbi:hypothetical protein SAMN05421546_0059 [Solilutibacter tolerans]|uniref:Uncharacterized protein n=1 Tax=Solilutibacter tolerans TaxID=1604334 RepID=A0A1N6N3H5_9GAMM|nr:hypothetical protein SAMN05421546_0059 [Lysobacter tolerans]
MGDVLCMTVPWFGVRRKTREKFSLAAMIVIRNLASGKVDVATPSPIVAPGGIGGVTRSRRK